jgi:hypothetical protein
MITAYDLIPGKEDQQFFRLTERLAAIRWDTPLSYCRFIAEDTARRVAGSRALFEWPFLRGDCHSHTQHSDGAGTVAETAAMSRAAGLDFQYVTDHWGLTQAPECAEHGLWVGQEPTTTHHHLGILGLSHAFATEGDFLADYAAAVAAGATVFVPHPTGWWPSVRYNAEQLRLLEELPSPFLMEICNGANNIVSAFDVTDNDAVTLWDHLLCLGRVVHAMGNTDAHAPHGIGMVWNAVFAELCEPAAVTGALRAGHSFVSDAPLLHIALGEARMGDRAGTADRSEMLQITAVDSRGLASVRVVGDGATLNQVHLDGTARWATALPLADSLKRYVRVEARSLDGRRAYSNPIYL